MEAIESIQGRRSIREYLPQAVDPVLIEAIIEDAAKAPWAPISAPEPWVFNVVRGTARIRAYGTRALDFARANRPAGDGYAWTEISNFSVFYDAPTVIIISGCADNRLALEECTRAGQILTISAFARGLGTCWVGSPMLWLRDPDVCVELRIPAGFTPYAVFTLGYAAAIPARPMMIQTRINWLGEDEL